MKSGVRFSAKLSAGIGGTLGGRCPAFSCDSARRSINLQTRHGLRVDAFEALADARADMKRAGRGTSSPRSRKGGVLVGKTLSQPAIQIFAEIFLFDLARQIAVGGGNRPRVGLDRHFAADALEFPLLRRPQKLEPSASAAQFRHGAALVRAPADRVKSLAGAGFGSQAYPQPATNPPSPASGCLALPSPGGRKYISGYAQHIVQRQPGRAGNLFFHFDAVDHAAFGQIFQYP